jgi:threonylcarbamoyladenosine tRNA methylthiotransferase MtaB
MAWDYKKSMVGTVQQVLFEEKSGMCFNGHAPNYVKVSVAGDDLHNQIRDVRITDVLPYEVFGELV